MPTQEHERSERPTAAPAARLAFAGPGEMRALCRTFDWSATPLGPVTHWPQSLRTAVDLCLGCGFPSCVWWGPDLLQIHNDAARALLQGKHPAALAVPASRAWSDLWPVLGPRVARALPGGETVHAEDLPLLVERGGAPETARFTFSCSPLRDETGAVAGVFVVATETTAKVPAPFEDGPRRQHDKEALRESEARYRALFESIDEGFCIVQVIFDAQERPVDCRFLELNPAAERHTGIGAAVGQTLRDTVPGIEQFWIDRIGRVARSGEPERFANQSTSLGRWFDVYAFRSGEPHEHRVALLFTDITARKQAEQALRESEERLARELSDAKTLQRISTELLSEQKPEALYRQLLEAAIALMGADAASVQMPDASGRPLCLTASRTPHSPSVAFSLRAGAPAGNPGGEDLPRQLPGTVPAAPGSSVLRGVLSTPLVARDGRALGTLSAHWSTVHETTDRDIALFDVLARQAADLIERGRAEAVLRESETRLRTLAALVPALLWQTDASGKQALLNPGWLDYTGQSLQETQDGGWVQAIHPEDQQESARLYEEAHRLQKPLEMQCRVRDARGDYRWFLVRHLPLRDAEGRVTSWFGAATDIHEQRVAHELLEHRVQERTRTLRLLLLRLERLQDDERRRIARELHDSLGQYLSLLSLSVQGLAARATDPQESERLARLREVLRRADHELDRIVFTLRPTALEDCGLGEAVSAHTRTWSGMSGTPVNLLLHGLEDRRLPATLEAAVFRVVQEALNNVARHARATRVKLSIVGLKRQLMASIEDDGVGFEPGDEGRMGPPGRSGWGLLGMKERIEALGGQFSLESQPGAGTTVLLRVPLAE